MPSPSTRTLQLMLGLALVLVALTMGLQRKADEMRLPPMPPDHLTLDDYVLGVTRTLSAAKGEARLTPRQATQLLPVVDLLQRDMWSQASVRHSVALELFHKTLTRAQAGAIMSDLWRHDPRVVDPDMEIIALQRLLTKRSADS